jgi:small-conductance mechanosensitive channel/CRP-like cAMP-binding protein
MSIWERLLHLTAASPFTGSWMSLGTALIAGTGLVLARRLLPRDDRHHGRGLLALLVISLLMGLLRTGLVAAGAAETIGAHLLAFVTTFCVATGAVGTVLMLALEVLPVRARIRVPTIFRDLVRAAVFVLIAFGVLSQSGVNVTSLITTAGVLTAVVGLALQNTIANLFAGAMLSMDRELSVDDWVQVGTRTGQIVQIRWRSTILRNNDGDTIIVPNGQMLGTEVYNFSRPRPNHRVWIRIGFHYRHPPNVVREVLAAAAREAPEVLPSPLPDAFPSEFGDHAVFYTLRFWINNIGRKRDIEGEVLSRVWYAAKRAGLEIPYPIHTVNVHTESEAQRQSAAEADSAERLRAVERLDIFAPLDRSERELLASGMQRVAFARGETIIRQGDAGSTLYVLAQGEVAVSLRRGSVDQEVATLRAGDFFGEMSLMTGEGRSATCTARTDTVAYLIDHATVRKVLNLRPTVADEMSAILATRQAALEKKGGEIPIFIDPAAERSRRLLSRIRDFFDLG